MESNKSRFNKDEQAILKTLLYSDIFDFSLTKNELWRFLITDKKSEKKLFEKALKALISNHVVTKDGYYCLASREDIIRKRKNNRAEVTKKLLIAKKAAYYLSLIPTVQFIGISGGLAVGNATTEDDIDFFIITKKKTLFMTRFWILCVLEWLHLRRKRDDKQPKDKICINLLIDDTKLAWPKRKQDLYIAHEIVQMQPLFERNTLYKKFLASNRWVGKLLPNMQVQHISFEKNRPVNYLSLRFLSFFLFLPVFERAVENLQKKYMKKHQTTEIVTNGHIALHPNDYRIKTMEILRLKCDKLGLLTNI